MQSPEECPQEDLFQGMAMAQSNQMSPRPHEDSFQGMAQVHQAASLSKEVRTNLSRPNYHGMAAGLGAGAGARPSHPSLRTFSIHDARHLRTVFPTRRDLLLQKRKRERKRKDNLERMGSAHHDTFAAVMRYFITRRASPGSPVDEEFINQHLQDVFMPTNMVLFPHRPARGVKLFHLAVYMGDVGVVRHLMGRGSHTLHTRIGAFLVGRSVSLPMLQLYQEESREKNEPTDMHAVLQGALRTQRSTLDAVGTIASEAGGSAVANMFVRTVKECMSGM